MSGMSEGSWEAMKPWEQFEHLHPEQHRARVAEAEYDAKCAADAARRDSEARWARIRAHDAEREARAAADAGYPDPATFRAAQPAVIAVAEALGALGRWADRAADRRAEEARGALLLRSEVAEALGVPIPGEADPHDSIANCRARMVRSDVEAWLAGGQVTDLVRGFIASLGIHRSL